MKLTLSLLAALLLSSAFMQKPDKGIKIVPLNHGISKSRIISKEKNAKSPSGNILLTDEFKIIKTTDTIPGELNAQFGVEYVVKSSKNQIVSYTIVWIFPEEMINKEGRKFKQLSYTTSRATNSPTYSNYTLEEDFEIVKGDWYFQIYNSKKELLFQKRFTVI